MLETAFKMYCNLKTRLLVGKPSPVPNYDLDYKFGTAWNATVEGMAVIESAKAEDKANSSKRCAVDPKAVSAFQVGTDDPAGISTDYVYVRCMKSHFDGNTTDRACCVDQGDRTPQVGDEIAITGFGGQVWWEGKIFEIKPPKRGKRTVPVYMASVFYAVDETKTEVKLSAKTCGPAQCIIGDIKIGGRLQKNSYSPGWVCLVPTEPTTGLVESDPAAPAAPNDWGGGAGSSSSEQTTANQTATDA